ncbi:hypothetical protein CR155_10580 [Pollutimonas nitritireducens]|uniref:DUF2818 domain-containing protein n=2 Tax=Pollutimonas nitritireducens TaxID=2045209 RepID=A0A2N4UFV8_9BURK|nr:DUF2818 family protein [Pollutimonas nitritireducens]PLC53875.1 hypothetical protein CR155_10580 [Pollutimonas nitritireducens]
MNQSFAVWILIGLSLITANLPFLAERPFLILPWTQKGEPAAPAWMQWIFSLIFLALLATLAYGAFGLIGGALVMASDLASVSLFLAKIGGLAVVIAALLAYPGWRSRAYVIEKSFFVRLLEMLMFYLLVGILGFAFEVNLGNRFTQGWEFYAVTFSLFLVLGYPGFVYRYLLRRPKPRQARTTG